MSQYYLQAHDFVGLYKNNDGQKYFIHGEWKNTFHIFDLNNRKDISFKKSDMTKHFKYRRYLPHSWTRKRLVEFIILNNLSRIPIEG